MHARERVRQLGRERLRSSCTKIPPGFTPDTGVIIYMNSHVLMKNENNTPVVNWEFSRRVGYVDRTCCDRGLMCLPSTRHISTTVL